MYFLCFSMGKICFTNHFKSLCQTLHYLIFKNEQATYHQKAVVLRLSSEIFKNDLLHELLHEVPILNNTMSDGPLIYTQRKGTFHELFITLVLDNVVCCPRNNTNLGIIYSSDEATVMKYDDCTLLSQMSEK